MSSEKVTTVQSAPSINVFHPPPSDPAPKPPSQQGQPTLPEGLKKKKNRISQLKANTRVKSNSTSTLFVSDTLTKPDQVELLRCIAVSIAKYVTEIKTDEERKTIPIFDERNYPLHPEIETDFSVVPTERQIFLFIDEIFDTEKLSHECGIMMLAYIDRVMSTGQIILDSTNWRRVVLSTLILASKVWEDQAVWNVDFLSVFPNVTVKDLGQLEKVLLRLLQYNVSLHGSQYAKYYFELRQLSEKEERKWNVKPLDKEGAKRLEAHSQELQEQFEAELVLSPRIPRSKSMDFEDQIKSPKAILN